VSQQIETLAITKKLYEDLVLLGVSQSREDRDEISLYEKIITNSQLYKKTNKLFKDGHHARAVEEAYKLLDNTVKKQAGMSESNLTGAKLMEEVFSVSNPKLCLNAISNQSERNEQVGYMMICSGCMTGIRNPRAHESDWEDTEERALQLLSFANHLIERVLLAEKQST